jgi:NAD(P)-dependent dehydrogenase (short-subunit alcohol dehydrogenase family)
MAASRVSSILDKALPVMSMPAVNYDSLSNRMDKRKLHNRVALITGASRGIGRAIARGYAKEGAAIAVTARSEGDLCSLVEEVQKDGGAAVAIPADLCDGSAPADVVRRVLESLGTIDILVNNAGLGSSSGPNPVVDFDDALWHKTLALNLTAPYHLTKAVLPIMLEKKWGRIINIASINGKLPAIHGAAYTASKHGLLGLTRTVALEVARDGITVNAICPGTVRTEMNNRRLEYDAKRLGLPIADLEARLTPIGRRLEPEEIVPMAVLLASDESAAITGQAFNICGGVAT